LSFSALWLNLPKQAGDFQYFKLKSLSTFKRNIYLLEKPLWDRATIYLLNQLKKIRLEKTSARTQTQPHWDREMSLKEWEGNMKIARKEGHR